MERQNGRVVRVGFLLVVLAVAIGVLIWSIRERAGVGREIVQHGTEQCELIAAPAGPEDIEIDHVLGFAFISAHDRRARPSPNGDLHLLDLDDPDATIVAIPRDGPRRFKPHGLSLVRVDEVLYVHVVNHAGDEGSTVEQFRFEAGRLHHLATVAGDALISPNDVAAVDALRFYVTNDHGTRSGLSQLFENLLGLRFGTVAYFDGEKFVTALEGQSMANGIALTADQSRLLVAETIAGTVTSYRRDPETGELSDAAYVPFQTAPDNLDVAADGSVWTVGHPRLFDFLAHARNAEALSPTDVYRIDYASGVFGISADVERVLMDDGRLLSGGSVAVVRGDQMLVGNVFEPGILRCTLPARFSVPLPAAPTELEEASEPLEGVEPGGEEDEVGEPTEYDAADQAPTGLDPRNSPERSLSPQA